jgi:voltage-gated potassium channel Kch
LSSAGEGGLLIIGADRWVLDLARAVERAGVEVVLVDSDTRNVLRARSRGFETFQGEALDDDILDELPIERLDLVLAATHDDHFNALTCLALAEVFGRERVLQLTPEGEAEPHLRGRSPWGEEGTFEGLATRRWGGSAFGVEEVTEEHTWEGLLAQHPDALPLFSVRGLAIAAVEGAPPKGKVVYVE